MQSRSQVRWLLAVAVVYVLAQLAAAGHVRLGWDETIYVSQVSPHVPAAFFSAPRARGISWLVAPVVVLTASRWALRIYLALGSGAGLVVAFWPWLRLRSGPVVPLAAAILASLWPALFYGSEAMPNLWVAFAAVAAVGWFLRSVQAPQGTHLFGLGVALAVAALFRPPDSAWLLLSLAAAVVLVPSWRRPVALGTVLGAGLVGWAPWLIEAQTSYGGVLTRLRAGSAIQGGTHLQVGVLTALRSVNGPALCRPCDYPVPVTGALFWLAGVVAVGAALVAARGAGRLSGTATPVLVGACMAVPYLFLLDYSAARFLLPTYGLMALPVAEGLLVLAAVGAPGRRVRTAVVAGVMALLVAYQSVVLAVVIGNADPQRESWAALASALRAGGVSPPCLVVGTEAAPIAYYAGCASYITGGDPTAAVATGQLRYGGDRAVAVIRAGRQPPPGLARRWHRLDVRTPYGHWRAYFDVPPRSAPAAVR